MKKRILSLLLALAMLCSLATASLAAQTADQRLAAVTAKVKAALELDTEQYDSFYGNLDEGALAPMWDLMWSGENGSLTVAATEEGKVLSLYRNENNASSPSRPGGNFAPTFPKGDRAKARTAAEGFLSKVLAKGERGELEDAGTDRLGLTYYRFNGKVLLNGLPAGLSCSVSVSAADNQVTSFYRDDLTNAGVMGGAPDPTPKAARDEAAKALRSTLALRLEYVRSEADESRAVLRYLPEYGDSYYVDALTGELVNLSQLYRDADKGLGSAGGSSNGSSSDSAPEAAPTAAPEGGLTDAELGGAALLKDVLDKAALEKKAAAVKALGLDKYTLSQVRYNVPLGNDGEIDKDGQVTATLRYGRQVNGAAWRRTITLDAKTGKLLQVYSSAWMPEKEVRRTVTSAAAQKAAETFLKAQCPDLLEKSALYHSSDALSSKWELSHHFTFCQQENGYFYPGNSIWVEVDSTDGSVSGYGSQFDTEVVLDSAGGIISSDQALDAWLGTYDVQLRYVMVPTAIDYSDPVYAPLKDMGMGYLYKLKLGYSLERDGWCSGIDAKTGEPVRREKNAAAGLTYSDVAGHWAEKQLTELARYNVGYPGGACRPDDPVTQLDVVALLASAVGYYYDPDAADAADDLYRYAYMYGILDPADRSDSLTLTRLGAAKLLVNALGYGEAAKLQGIYKTGFTDERSIPAADLGYAALAKGLGILGGYDDGRCKPMQATTRAGAAVMLYNVMSR